MTNITAYVTANGTTIYNTDNAVVLAQTAT